MYTHDNWLPEVFNDFFNTVGMGRTNATAPAINVLENNDKYMVELAAPGLSKSDFDINIYAEGDLTIKMEKHQDKKDEGIRYLRREFSYDKYEQTLILPDDVDTQNIAATMTNGVLTVDLPKVKKADKEVVRSIEVK
ncbi:MAG: Hsp20/alpha crystallin family protein [Bacteroidota bacterium]|nr:Hsp20/alpha crystallin family protein [Bacteroidota bacterium]